nr:hypothetical protein [Dictyobacter arantiisoli]
MPAQDQHQQLDPGNPPLGPLFQQTDRLRAERESHRLRKRLDFGGHKPQSFSAQFSDLLTCPQARKPRRIHPCADQQMQARGKMVQQKEQQGLTRLGHESVDVIQDQDRLVLEQAFKIVEETSQDPFVLTGMPGPIGLSYGAQARIDARKSCDE